MIKIHQHIIDKYIDEASKRAFFYDKLNINYSTEEDGDVEIIKIINGKFKNRKAIITYNCFFPFMDVLIETDWLLVVEPYSETCERILKII